MTDIFLSFQLILSIFVIPDIREVSRLNCSKFHDFPVCSRVACRTGIDLVFLGSRLASLLL